MGNLSLFIGFVFTFLTISEGLTATASKSKSKVSANPAMQGNLSNSPLYGSLYMETYTTRKSDDKQSINGLKV